MYLLDSRKTSPESDVDCRGVELCFGLFRENTLKLGASLKHLKLDGRNLDHVGLEETPDSPDSGLEPE